jgi:hypothetical protein
MGNQNYDRKKDFACIQKTLAYIINTEVTRPFGDFYAGVQLPSYYQQGTSTAAGTSKAPNT